MTTLTVSSSEFRRNMPSIVGKAEETGASIVVIKNSRPWFEINPISRAKVPTEETLQALQEIEARRKDPDAPIYHDINDLFADLVSRCTAYSRPRPSSETSNAARRSIGTCGP